MDDAAAAQGGLTLATWFWLLVPMLSCVVFAIATWIGAVLGRRKRPLPSA